MTDVAIAIPPSLMREQSATWRIVASTVSPGQSASGVFQLVRMDGGGMWMAQWNNVFLRTADQIRTWRAINASAESGVVPLIVPQCDRRQFPAPVVAGAPVYSYGLIPHSDGSPFSDGSGYDQPVVVAATVGPAALRATTMTMHFVTGGPLRGGEIFSIEHPTQGWRRYEIKTVAIDGSGNSVVTFRPPLREAVGSATPIEFDCPRCVMRLSRQDGMDMEIELRKFANPSASFVEFFYPT